VLGGLLGQLLGHVDDLDPGAGGVVHGRLLPLIALRQPDDQARSGITIVPNAGITTGTYGSTSSGAAARPRPTARHYLG
jgi:hypothetical protein